MTSASHPTPVSPSSAPDRERAAIGGDLHTALARYVRDIASHWQGLLADLEHDHAQATWRLTEETVEDRAARIASMLSFTRMVVQNFTQLATAGPPDHNHLSPEDVSWFNLTELWQHDEAAGRALWTQIQQTAMGELRAGRTGAQVIEGSRERPMARAEYLAVWQALADGLQPQTGADHLLIDSMAQALMLQRHWLKRVVETESLDAIRRGDQGYRDGYAPPRLDEAAAVDRATAMQDRFHRQFLRLLTAYRDQRRVFGTFVVAGGQVNIATEGGQQLITTRTIRGTSAPRPRPTRRPTRRKRGTA